MGASFSNLCPAKPREVLAESHGLVSPGSPARNSRAHLTDADFKDWKRVGEGACGEVYSVVHKQTGEVWAVKKIKRGEIDRYVRDECLNLARCGGFSSPMFAYCTGRFPSWGIGEIKQVSWGPCSTPVFIVLGQCLTDLQDGRAALQAQSRSQVSTAC
jgi:hypothetical protein